MGTSGLIYISFILHLPTVMIKKYIPPSDERHIILYKLVSRQSHPSHIKMYQPIYQHKFCLLKMFTVKICPLRTRLKKSRCSQHRMKQNPRLKSLHCKHFSKNFLLLDGFVTCSWQVWRGEHISFLQHSLSRTQFHQGWAFPPRHSFQIVSWIPWMKSDVNVDLIHEMLRLPLSRITFLAWQQS